MESLHIFFIFVLGTIIGSFINVVSLRYNTGMPISNGRSKCFNCSITLKWYEMIPLVSFFFLRGKCKSCSLPISLQYPLVELLSGLVFLGIVFRQIQLWPMYTGFGDGALYSTLFFVYYALVFSILMVIMIYDMWHKVIPNSFVYAFILLSLLKLGVFLYIQDFAMIPLDWLDLLTPLFLSLPFALLWLISGGKWIGFGDAKLVFGIGALLGFVFGVGAVVLGFWLGAIWSIGMLIMQRFGKKKGRVSMTTEVPFAPFLIIATMIVFFWRLDVVGLGDFISLMR